jgi:hypothetical protein
MRSEDRLVGPAVRAARRRRLPTRSERPGPQKALIGENPSFVRPSETEARKARNICVFRPALPRDSSLRSFSLGAVDAPTWLPIRSALNELRTLIEQCEIVDRRRVAWVEAQRGVKLSPSPSQVPAQHIRVSLVIEKTWGVTHQFSRGRIAAICKIESPQSIVARRQADPGGRVFGGFFDGVLEVPLG